MRIYHAPHRLVCALLLYAGGLAAGGLLAVPAAAQFTDGQAAFRVLGQSAFTTNGFATTATGMNFPGTVVVDPARGKLYVADVSNNRVLRFAYPTTGDGQPAEAVLGQPDFTSNAANRGGSATATGMNFPYALTLDGAGRLWVADHNNNRVLQFDDAANKANGAPADGVLGQPDFTSTAPATSATGMSRPSKLAIDGSGALWVADFFNSRVLRFDGAAAKANGAPADGVLGQPDFTSSGTATSATGMGNPFGVAVDAAGRLWVADTFNHRVLRFDDAANKANGAAADGVLGQSDFTSSSANGGGATSATGLSAPYGVAVDPVGRLYVPDFNNHRVLLFDGAALKANGAAADGVLGQSTFTSNLPVTSAAGMNGPLGVTVDAVNDRLWVADYSNHRVLGFQAASPLPVELSSFTARLDGTAASLQWETASERGNAGFSVEHRVPEGEAWIEAGFVPGAGTTDAPQAYAFSVPNLAPGTHAFRLKQVDLDGAHAYSDEVEVAVALHGTHALAVWPNPASGPATVRLSIAEAQPVTVALYDVLGRRVAVLFAGEAGGTVEARVPEGLAPGTYLVRAEGAAFAESLRVTVAR